MSKQPFGSGAPRVINFQFNISQGFALEFGNQYMRVFSDGAPVTEAGLAISDITQADPAGLVVLANGYSNGDWVALASIDGMAELNGGVYIVQNVATNSFTLTDLFGNPVNSTSFAPYTSGGTSARIFTIETPYLVADLPLLKFAQSADTMTLTHSNYPPMDLVRITDTEWTITASTFVASISAPATCRASATTNPSNTTTPPTLPTAFAYCVTAVSAATGEESVSSPIANVTNSVDIASTAGSLIINWSSVTGAGYYNVYKASPSYNTNPGDTTNALPVPAGAIFGFMMTAFGTQAVDSNIVPNFDKTPPLHEDPFAPGQIIALNIATGGSGQSNITITITTATGSGFVGVPIVVGGVLTAVQILDPGKNYQQTDTVSFGGPGSKATGNITFGTIPHNGDTLTLNGQVWTFVTALTAPNQTLIGSSLALTLSQLAYDLSASTDAGLVVAHYSANASQLLITYATAGTGGNAYTLAASVATPSGGTLTGGGTGTFPTGSLDVGPETGTYPGVVAYFQQRRVYAATVNSPDTYFMSQPGAFLNFDSSIPVVDTDAITGTPWAQQVNGVQFMIQMPAGLVVMTGLGTWVVNGTGGSTINPQPVTPSSDQALQQGFNGCNNICPPFVENYDIIFVQAKGSIVRDVFTGSYFNIFVGNDLTQISGHLFTGYTLSQVAWTEEPFRVAWYVRNDGVMLSLTYLKEQEVYGWGRHDTFGQFISICSVIERPVDALYMVAARPAQPTGIGGAYYIERMNNRIWNSVEDVWAVDCGLKYPQPAPNADIASNGTSGVVNFLVDSPVFSLESVGSVIRVGGGIATIIAYMSPTEVTAVWNLSPSIQFTDVSSSIMVPQALGSWTLTQPTTVIGGLTHLVGQTVTGLADGVVIPPQIVSATGTITLSVPASSIVVGLGFQAQVQSVYLNTQAQQTIQGRRKTITALTTRVVNSLGFKMGSNEIDGSTVSPPVLAPVWTNLQPAQVLSGTYTSPGGALVTKLYTGDLRDPLVANWTKPGQAAVQQDLPLPLSLTAFVPETLEGDVPEEGYGQKEPRDPRNPPRGPGAWMLKAV